MPGEGGNSRAGVVGWWAVSTWPSAYVRRAHTRRQLPPATHLDRAAGPPPPPMQTSALPQHPLKVVQMMFLSGSRMGRPLPPPPSTHPPTHPPMVVRTMLLYGSWAVREYPLVWQCIRSTRLQGGEWGRGWPWAGRVCSAWWLPGPAHAPQPPCGVVVCAPDGSCYVAAPPPTPPTPPTHLFSSWGLNVSFTSRAHSRRAARSLATWAQRGGRGGGGVRARIGAARAAATRQLCPASAALPQEA